VYFGTDSIPPLLAFDVSDTTYDPGTLENDSTYFWKIVAYDTGGDSTSGSTWSFETEADTSSWSCGGTITDIDGNTYATVQIDNQCWMKENLKTTTYRNGTAIPNVTGNTAWSNLSTGAYVW